jgi:hypothetical protein
MTEDEGDLLHSITNQYWHDFSELVNSTLLLAPPHLRDLLEEKLQESSSVYGRDDLQTYEKDRHHPFILTRWAMPDLLKSVRCPPPYGKLDPKSNRHL